MIRKGVLKAYDSTTHQARVQIVGSLSTWLTGIPVSQSLAPRDMVAGRYVGVLTPDESKPGDSVVVTLWTASTPPTGRAYVEITPAPIVRHWTSPVSSAARSATVSSIASAEITLTANEAYRFWCAPGEWDPPDGNAYIRVHNATRDEYAWISGSTAVNKLTVTDAADIAAWSASDVLDTSIAGLGKPEDVLLDISPSVPEGATHVYLKLQVSDSGTIVVSLGAGVSVDGTSGTLSWVYPQVSGIWTVANVITAIASDRTLALREYAAGADSGSFIVTILGYFI